MIYNKNMAHYNSYDSFKTTKSKEKKEKAKSKSYTTIQFADDTENECGTVIEVTYQKALVNFKKQTIFATSAKPNIALNKVIFPGDKVIIKKENGFMITDVIKRKNALLRSHKDGTKNSDFLNQKIIAANIDIAVIVASAKEPPLHHKFIDRYLLILNSSNIPAVICLNKADLMDDEEQKIIDLYKNLNIPIIKTSAKTRQGIDELKNILKNKQAIFVGNSGVGKSTLTALVTGKDIKTGEVSAKSSRGKHTTTSSHYYIWEENSTIIDTPGIRSLDISNFSPKEIEEYFTEFEKYKGECKYDDCMHFNEPLDSCKIKQCVKNGLISEKRYLSYIRMIEDVLDK